MKVVYKFGTGHEIPEDAKYLCTQVETLEECNAEDWKLSKTVKTNFLVWHYYELPLPRPEKAKG